MSLLLEKLRAWDDFRRFNGQIYFVPITNWQLAAWAITRSTRFVVPEQVSDPVNPETFARLYAARNHAPVLWYTPGGSLGDEVYDFLHGLPGIGRIVIFCERVTYGPHGMDALNLKAMVDEAWEWEHAPPFLKRAKVDPIPLPFLESGPDEGSARVLEDHYEDMEHWLRLDARMRAMDPPLPVRLPRVVIVVPATPQCACAIAPLAAYVQATLLYFNPQRANRGAFLEKLVATVFQDDPVDEIWLVGHQTQGLQEPLESIIRDRGRELERFDRKAMVRAISGHDHFAVSEQTAVLLLTYRYLDWMLLQALTHPQKREYFFEFLVSDGMNSLYHHCNRVLDLADQLRRSNFKAIMAVHHLYWSISDRERRRFIGQFQEWFKKDRIVAEGMAVIADYPTDEPVPHHLIDAAAFAARRAGPLLLLQPLPSETSYYISTLMDKIDNQLAELTEHMIEQSKLANVRDELRERMFRVPVPGPGGEPSSDDDEGRAEAELEWQEVKPKLDLIDAKISCRKLQLMQHVKKTGEVLYESLVPLAVRNTLRQLDPRFLAAFIQDPSLPIELIRDREAPRAGEGVEDDLVGFWSLRYAIGHLSSVNFYETNLTSNITFFTPRALIQDRIRVLLCSNPTRDLYFSTLEAAKIAALLQGQEVKIHENKQVKLDLRVGAKKVEPTIDLLQNQGPEESRPTQENLLKSLRREYDIVHYSGHAFFDNVLPGRSGLLLNGGVLTASDVRFMLDLRRSPIIYANACSAGRIKSVSSRFTGLAAAFIRAGAAGYISPLWSVDDRDAAGLAYEFYHALLEGSYPIGECLRIAKRAQAQGQAKSGAGSITWASLVLYGDPSLSIVEPMVDPVNRNEELIR